MVLLVVVVVHGVTGRGSSAQVTGRGRESSAWYHW